MANKKYHHNRKSINIMCAVIAVVLIAAMIVPLVASVAEDGSIVTETEQESLRETVLTKAREKLSTNDDFMLYIEGYQNEHSGSAESVPTYFAYQIAGSKSSSERSYSYKSTTGSYNHEYWYKDGDQYIDYIYSEDVDSFVECPMETEPLTVDPFKVLDDMEVFELLDGEFKWGSDGKGAYCFQTVGSSEEYGVVYERIYISKDDYALLGAIKMGMHDLDDIVTEEIDDVSAQELYEQVGVEWTDTDEPLIETTTRDSEEIIFRFEYYFSNASMLFIEKPESYMTAEEYAEWKGIEADEESSENGEE